MQKKLNEDFIESYSEQFAAKISDDFFASKPFINGQEILSVTPSKQVNFFIIKLLFNNWQQESQRLESPFFDYTAPEVKEAMLQFMNVLSRHIKVGRKEFEILLQDAVRDTLFLIMAPNAYMEIEMDRRGTEELTEKTAKNILKYLKISKEEFSEYLMENIGLDRDEIDIYDGIISEDLLLTEIDVLNEIHPITLKLLEEGDDVEDVDEELQETDDEEAILNVEPEDIFKPIMSSSSEQETDNLTEELESDTDSSDEEIVQEEFLNEAIEIEESPEMDESDAPEDADDESSDEVEEGEINEDLIPETDTSINEALEEELESEIEEQEEDDAGVSEDVEDSVLVSKWEVSEKAEEDDSVEDEPDSEEDKFDDEETVDESAPSKSKEIITNIDPDDEDEEEDEDSLNARFEDPTSPASIAEAHENQVDSMMNAISLNQRFMFINELFDGDPEVFKESIDMVDECGSFDESVEKLVQNYARDYHWDMNSEEVKELLKIIFRRFR